MTKNPEDLLNNNLMTNLLMKYRDKLKLSQNFKILEIKRSLALSPKSYIISYKILSNNQTIILRGNASISISRLTSYEVLKILDKNGFGDNEFKIPQYFVFDPDYNLLLYHNIEGNILISQINKKELNKDLKLCANWLKKLHNINDSINLNKYNFSIITKDLMRSYPDLAENVQQIEEDNLGKIQNKNSVLIHGDYQPNNIIIDSDNIWVFDFNDSAYDNPMIDLASFLTQLRTMLLRFGDIKRFEELQNIFINEYRNGYEIDSKMENDLKIYQKLYYLKILASLSSALDDNSQKKEILDNIYKWYEEL